MAFDCDLDALDALAREAPCADRAALELHLARCASCAQELAWLRAENAMFHERPAVSVDHLWPAVAASITPPSAPSASPYRIAPMIAPVAPPSRLSVKKAFLAGLLVATAGFAAVAFATFSVTDRGRSAHHRVARNAGPTELAVSGPVTLHVETWAADVALVAGEAGRIRVSSRDADAAATITPRGGGRYELSFDGARRLANGALQVELPPGSGVEVLTASGDVALRSVGGSLRVNTASGDVRAFGVQGAEVATSSGDVELSELSGDVRVRTSSGDVNIHHAGAAGAIELQSQTGNFDWSGLCAAGCRIDARSTQGDVRLDFTEQSGFAVRYRTVTGELSDALATGVGRSGEGHFRDASGSVSVTTTTGNLSMRTLAGQ